MPDKTRILYLMAGHPSIFGGGKRVFLQIMKYLNKNKFHSYSCCALNKEQEELLTKQDTAIVHVDIQHDPIWPSMNTLIKLLVKEKIDIIHSQGARADVYSRLAAKLARKKIKVVNTIATLVEGYDVGFIKKMIYCTLDRLSERYVDKFIVVSNSLRDKLIMKHYIPEEKVITIHNGIELHEYRPDGVGESSSEIRREFDLDDSEFTICAIGRMVWEKGFEFLIRSIPEIVQDGPKARFLLVGEGPLRPRLEALTRRLNLDGQVIFTGFRSDIKGFLSAADILVVPSLLEGFPMITLEAMAMAKPIVATQINGIIEQITDGEEGILVPPRNPRAIALAILKLINDSEFSSRLARASRRKIESYFSLERLVRETEKVYLSLLETS